MCGIAGIWFADGDAVAMSSLITRMTNAQRHRGPDDEGYCLINTHTGDAMPCAGRDTAAELSLPALDGVASRRFDLALGHRRLSILDISAAGHQPMASEDGRLWIVYNGEIYNYIELREELKARGYRFRSQTDTEVILAAYQAWGTDCLEKFNGIWAFALWDGRNRQLFCSRDRAGVKPFYYSWQHGTFRFASEIKAIVADPAVPRVADAGIAFDYLGDGRLQHCPRTFFRGIYRLMPAQYLVVTADDLRRGEIEPRTYWDLDPDNRLEGLGTAEYARRFYELLEHAIRLQLRSDVPIGTCLSGGLDSSTIACVVNRLLRKEGVAAAQIGERQKTFSSCFEDARFDERQYITEVLNLTGAESNYVFPDGARLVDELPELTWYQDEPFGGTSIYAQWNVFRLAGSRGMKVMLDGQGGDEILAGYTFYHPFYHLELLSRGAWAAFLREWKQYRRLLGCGRKASARFLCRLGKRVWLGNSQRPPPPASYPWLSPELVRQYGAPESWRNRKYDNLLKERLYRRFVDGLPALLHYEDRNSMAYSIEARVPLLDHRLVEFAFALPDDQLIRDGLTKFVLREATRGILPEKIRLRTDKMGFVTPEKIWFERHLAAATRERIHSAPQHVKTQLSLTETGRLLDAAARQQLDADTVNTLWRILNFCVWCEVFQVSSS